VQQQTGIPYALFDGRIESTPAALRALGKLMGEDARAEQLAGWYEKELQDARQRVARAATKPRVYYGRGPAGLQTGGKGSINVEVLEFLGARNVAAEARPGLVTVSLEQVLLWNPDSDPHHRSGFLEARFRRPALARRDRGRAQAGVPVPAPALRLVRRSPGINRLLGIWWAGKLLYPATFDVDLRAKGEGIPPPVLSREPTPEQLDACSASPE